MYEGAFWCINAPLDDIVAFCWVCFIYFLRKLLNFCSDVQIRPYNTKPFISDEHEISIFHFNLLQYLLFLNVAVAYTLFTLHILLSSHTY